VLKGEKGKPRRIGAEVAQEKQRVEAEGHKKEVSERYGRGAQKVRSCEIEEDHRRGFEQEHRRSVKQEGKSANEKLCESYRLHKGKRRLAAVKQSEREEEN
jgi:hypothetical protein